MGLTVLGPPAAALPVDDAPATARLVVNGLQAVVGPSDAPVPAAEEEPRLPTAFTARVLVENLTDAPLDGLRLVMTVYDRVTSRSALRNALDSTTTTGLSDGDPVLLLPLETLPPGGIAQLQLTIDAQEAGLIDADNDVSIHPVVLSVDRGRPVLDEVRTAAIGVARPVARPLQAVAVAPLDGPAPGIAAGNDPASLLPGGRLDRLLRALEAAPPDIATVAPAAHALEDLQRLVDAAEPGATDMLARLRAVVTERAGAVVSTPYALADTPALATSTTTSDLATAAIVAGRERLLDLAGAAPGRAHLLIPRQTQTSLDLAPTDVLIAHWDASSGPDLAANPSADIPPALRQTRSRSGRSLDVLMGDPWVASHLAAATGRHGWAIDAHRVVVESAMVFAQAPGREGRAFAVLPPVGWGAPGRLADELYGRLAAAPWLALGGPADVAARAEIDAPWEAPLGVAATRTELIDRVGALQDRLGGLAAAVVDVDERPVVVARGDDLLRAMTVWPQQGPQNRADRLLDDLDAAISEAIGIVVIPDDSAVTLASERGVIPVTIQHPEGVPLDVVVEVTTPGGLTFREDSTSRAVRLDQGGTATVSFEATALGRGSYPMAVTVRTPTGDLVLATEVVTVRASAVSRPALLAVGGVVLLLLLVGRIRRSGRSERPKLEVVQ